MSDQQTITLTVNISAQRDVIAILEKLAETGAIRRFDDTKARDQVLYHEPDVAPAYGFATVTKGGLAWHARGHGGGGWGKGPQIGTPGPERLRLCVESYNAENRRAAEIEAPAP